MNSTTKAIDWQCEVNMPTDIKISYSVRAFLGEPDANPQNWATDPNYVGQIASMSSPRMDSDVIVTGNIALTERLAQKHQAGELKSLSKEDVAAYLKEHFSWRIQALDYSEIPRDNPPKGLNVTVYNVPISIPHTDDEVPSQDGDVEYNDDIEGNPPVYNGSGPDGTNSTTPASDTAGRFDPASGTFVWKNVTEAAPPAAAPPAADSQADGQGGTKIIYETEMATQYITVGGDDAAPTPTPTPSSEAESSTTPAPVVDAGTSTKVVIGTHTEYMTSIAIEYVTVMPGQK